MPRAAPPAPPDLPALAARLAEASGGVLFADGMAALLAAKTGRPPAGTHTIRQYLWQRKRRERVQGKALPADIPAPHDYRYPPGRNSGMLRPCWLPADALAWVAARQVPGKPRADGQPRVARRTAYRKPGRARAG